MTTLSFGEVQFTDHFVPALPGGHYRIQVTQTIDGVNDANIPESSQEFIVRAPRFVLPDSDVGSMFPPANGSGQYDLTLPHVVLTKKVLPWENRLRIPGTVPWMALLVLSDDEIKNGDLKSPTLTRSCTVAEALAKPEDNSVIVPAVSLEGISGEEQQLTCQTITIDGQLFQKILPSAAELPYLCHCRHVHTAGTVSESDGQEDAWFAVVTANRFPLRQNPDPQLNITGRNMAHLVSLEGWEAYLDDEPPAIPADQAVRLISLASWSFTCLPEGSHTFSSLVNQLAHSGPEALNNSLLLKLPVPAPSTNDASAPDHIVQQYFSQGYVGVNYETRTGESTFALYRGPFASQPVAKIQRSKPYYTSAAAMIYDDRLGVFDLSLSSAWGIGRSLALADSNFSLRLLGARKQIRQATDRLLEYDSFMRQGRARSFLDSTVDHVLQNDSRVQLSDQQSTGSQASTWSIEPEWMQNRLTAKRNEVPAAFAHQAFVNLLRNGVSGSIGDMSRLPGLATGSVRLETRSLSSEDANPLMQMETLLDQSAAATWINEAIQDEIRPIAEWLIDLKNVVGVPFHHLVPHPTLLQPETLRFFQIDQNWLAAMVDGALSVALHTSRDVNAQQLLLRNTIQDAMDQLSPNNRSVDLSGILVRSALVSGWPGLTIRGYKADQAVPIVRMDKLSPDVMIVIFDDTPERIELSEPAEGLQFGVDDQGRLDLRYISGENAGVEAGDKPRILDVATQQPLAPYGRAGSKRVLNLCSSDPQSQDLIKDLQSRLKEENLSSSGFALQMLSAPGRIAFS